MNKKIDKTWWDILSKEAIENMSPQDIEKYKKYGENMYGSVDYEATQVDKMMNSPVDDSIFYIIEGIKSGLHPSMLEDDEKDLLLKIKGDEWWKEYGYVKEDLDDIVTLGKK
jgi:hypothetical protein